MVEENPVLSLPVPINFFYSVRYEKELPLMVCLKCSFVWSCATFNSALYGQPRCVILTPVRHSVQAQEVKYLLVINRRSKKATLLFISLPKRSFFLLLLFQFFYRNTAQLNHYINTITDGGALSPYCCQVVNCIQFYNMCHKPKIEVVSSKHVSCKLFLQVIQTYPANE